MLQAVSNVAPRAVYVCANTTSTSGLTVSLHLHARVVTLYTYILVYSDPGLGKRQMLQAVSNMAPQALYRVPTPPGKSWNCVCKISRTWKVLENEFCPGKSWNCICKISRTCKVLENEIGPGKSWNLLGSDAGAMMQTQTPKLFLCYFFATCDNDEHILQYGCCYHTIYIWLVTVVCLYLNIAGLRQSPGKMLLGSWKSHGTFVTRRVGTLHVCANMTSTAGLTVSPHTRAC